MSVRASLIQNYVSFTYIIETSDVETKFVPEKTYFEALFTKNSHREFKLAKELKKIHDLLWFKAAGGLFLRVYLFAINIV